MINFLCSVVLVFKLLENIGENIVSKVSYV